MPANPGAFLEFGGDFAARHRGLSMSAPPAAALLLGKALANRFRRRKMGREWGMGAWKGVSRAFLRLAKIEAHKSSMKLSATYPALLPDWQKCPGNQPKVDFRRRKTRVTRPC
ncbi:hypothetical protein KL86PLE_70214 [uncultured Pleomorphomonas sp.]|uniref:Uncharacterized protein n=1 Tax=uncultured Pleomorphomonas sp. TaxID=442121 RepID=A0A212LLX2_9HYPH|nr:hypothetical protein KL86PLE_70214 [uncultured Pleomorphomonas sp.]